LRYALATFVLAPLAAACTDFENPTTIIDLRMLAVQTEPSEVILDADLSNPAMPVVDPANNPGILVTPLIVDPRGEGRPVTYTISACPNNPFAAAPQGGGQGGGAFPSGGARTTVGSALCDENGPNTWVLTEGTVPAERGIEVFLTIPQLTAAFMADIFPDQFGNLHGGFDLGMPLTLDIKVDAGTEQIRGVKRVLYWATRINDAQVANQNPTIDRLDLFNVRDEATFEPMDPPEEIKPAPEMPHPVDEGLRTVWIMPSAGNAESFQTTVIDPDTHRAVPFTVERETLRYRFFATAGTFAPANTSTERNPVFDVTKPSRIESQYTLPTADQITTEADGTAVVTIWVVVRDDRGGESWQQRQLRIKP
jgi:hypothetical protein